MNSTETFGMNKIRQTLSYMTLVYKDLNQFYDGQNKLQKVARKAKS